MSTFVLVLNETLPVCLYMDAAALLDDVIGPGGNKTVVNKSSFIL